MKRRLTTFTVVIMSVLMAGCAIPQLPEMTETQEELVTEYAAGLLLKYDDSFENGILSAEELEIAEAKEREKFEKAEKQKKLAEEYVAKSEAAKKEKEKEKKEKEGKGEEAEKPANTPNLVDPGNVGYFLNYSDVSISYAGYSTTKTYPESGNNVFSVDASMGKELVVVKYTISNNTADDQSISMDASQNKFRLVLADGTSASSCATLLLDDMSMYKNTITPGASDNVVLVFEVGDGVDLSGATVEMNNGVEKGIMNL